MDRGVMRQRSWCVMRQLAEGVALLLIAGACATGESAPAATQPPRPDAGLINGPTAEHYLADVDHPLRVAVGEAPTAWTVPAAPILPDGQPAVRFALIPADCEGIEFELRVDAPRSPDPWMQALSFAGSIVVEDGIQMAYDGRPELPFEYCLRGVGPGFLDVGYFRLADVPPSIDVSARIGESAPAVQDVTVIAVYTDIDAERPVYTQSRQTLVGPASAGEPGAAPPTEASVTYPFSVATLPDGTTATRWQARVTGCGPAVGHVAVEVTVTVGDGQPIAIGSCEGQSYGSADVELPVPPDGTPIQITTSGTADTVRVQVSEYQWRETP